MPVAFYTTTIVDRDQTVTIALVPNRLLPYADLVATDPADALSEFSEGRSKTWRDWIPPIASR